MTNERDKARGQSLTEYTVITSALLVALFVPWNGEQAPVVQFLEAVRAFHANASYALSLP